MTRIPLAEKMRPTSIDDVVGQSHILTKDGVLRLIVQNKEPVSLILWGPPGTGKTTLARIIANDTNADFIEISAVTSGKKDIEQVIEHARQNWNLKVRTVLFVDEIHRFNKAQQDAFLPHVESGLIVLIGATTENPSFEVITPLLSRMRVLVLHPLKKEDLETVITRALKKEKRTDSMAADAVSYLAEISHGDARVALGTLELALKISKKVTERVIKTAAQSNMPSYDKKGEDHYNIISAFIKSMRGGDVTATLYYLSRMIDAGEDPKFIARRMIIFASEDIGLAGNGALSLAVAAFQAVERVGFPEANYSLYHCAVALAKSKKSREITSLMSDSKKLAKSFPHSQVPLEVRNAPTSLMKGLGYSKGYKWESEFRPDGGFLPPDVQESL